MNLTKSDTSLNKMIDSFFNSSISDIIGADFTDSQPSANIVENDGHFAISLAVPGFSKEDFSIDILKDQLSISAELKDDHNTEEQSYTRREYNYKGFKRSFHLPETIDREDITALYQDGILLIKVGKKEKVADLSRRIKIS